VLEIWARQRRSLASIVRQTIETPCNMTAENFNFEVYHECGWGGRGKFEPSRYNSSRAKCIKCIYCNMYFSPNKFIFHFHKTPESKYNHPDAANFNSWRRHLKLVAYEADDITHAWEDVKAMFNGGSRKRLLSSAIREQPRNHTNHSSNVVKKPGHFKLIAVIIRNW
jgi:hypothetical protein